jgi:mevalonate kinase
MNLALTVLSDLPPEMHWSLGGGTALALHLNHRVSFDVDIFLEHPGALKELMKNPKTKQLSENREFQGNYLKIIRPEGEIDFILAANITDVFCQTYDFEGGLINIETPVEIIAKKIKYRGSKFTLRDTYDLAAVIEAVPNVNESLENLEELFGEFGKVLQRIEFLQANTESLNTELMGANHDLQKKMFEICIETLRYNYG